MPPPYTTLNARVKQKVATEEYWLSVEDELGVIFEGEQAFVYNDSGHPVNFKIGDGTKKFSELPYFITYFNNVTNCKILSYLDANTNQTINSVFINRSKLAEIILINNSGSEFTLNIGTTDGGSEIASVIVPNDVASIQLDQYFQNSTTVYLTGLTGINYSMFILYYQLDESPAIPTGGGGSVKRWANGVVYSFIPTYVGHTDASWDFLTGLGKEGTDFEGAVLWGTNGLPDLSEFYLVGFKTGDTLGGNTGNASGNVILTDANLPEHSHLMFNGDVQPGGGNDLDDTSHVRYQRDGSLTRAYIMAKSTTTPTRGRTSKVGSVSPAPISIKPKSKIVLYFTGLPA